MIPDPPEPRDGPPGRPRQGVMVGVLLLVTCYLTGLAINNLAVSDVAGTINRIFPRIGQGSTVDTSAVNQAWRVVQDQYVLRSISADIGTKGAEKGVIDMLKQQYNDRFTTYYTADQYAQLQRNLSGQSPPALLLIETSPAQH